MKLGRIWAFCFLAVAVAASPAFGQLKNETVLDKIVAVVGDQIIMKSEVDGKVAMMKYQNPNLKESDEELWKQALNASIDENLIVAKAIEDSITVTDDEIDAEWNKFKDNLVSYYGSIKRVEDVYGMSITRIHYEYRDIIKKQLLAQKLQARKFADVKPTPKEVEEFYEKYKDSLPQVPERVEIYHIVKYLGSSLKEKKKLRKLAEAIRDSILNGADFEEMARKHSQDPGTAENGGNLGWIEKGALMKEFEEAAFELPPGGISEPVETPFGFHIIQTLKKNRDSVLCRHILIKFGASEEEKAQIQDFLRALKDSAENGTKFEDLARKYSDEKETRGFGGKIAAAVLDALPENLKAVVSKLKDGEISDPLPYNPEPTKEGYHIVYRKKTIPAHAPNLKDDYELIEQRAKTYKQYRVYQDWVKSLRKEIYWEIKN